MSVRSEGAKRRQQHYYSRRARIRRHYGVRGEVVALWAFVAIKRAQLILERASRAPLAAACVLPYNASFVSNVAKTVYY